ncbi:hypothetical protein WJX72_005421 [[Myrmecia] bisecta]|uniref:C2 domain-containing protein n=1 Tax=[Myrmecia] bisecta TaxID=41462 RepID=A0AAW1QQR2_9CHLO
MAPRRTISHVSALNLRDTNVLGSPSLFVRFEIGSEHLQTSVAKHTDENPRWEDEPLLLPDAADGATQLVIKVYNQHHLRPDSLVGSTALPLSQLDSEQGITRVILTDKVGVSAGELSFWLRDTGADRVLQPCITSAANNAQDFVERSPAGLHYQDPTAPADENLYGSATNPADENLKANYLYDTATNPADAYSAHLAKIHGFEDNSAGLTPANSMNFPGYEATPAAQPAPVQTDTPQAAKARHAAQYTPAASAYDAMPMTSRAAAATGSSLMGALPSKQPSASKILFATAATGASIPVQMLHFATELAARGHHVTLAAPERQRSRFQASGVHFYPLPF